MNTFRIVLVAVVMWSVVTPAQGPIVTSTNVAFDVTSVKPNNSGSTNSSTSGRPDGFIASNVTLRQLIIFAYRLRQFQLASGPGWLTSERWDILARSPEGVKPDNPAMTRALLRDRFKLLVHTETREEQIYALVAARQDGRLGPNMKPSTLDCTPVQPGAPTKCGMNASVVATGGKLTGTGQSLEQMVAALGNFGLNRQVLNRSGIKGTFDFELQWTTETVAGSNSSQSSDAPSIFAALQEQLGLKLESDRGPVEFLIIDRVERPEPD